MNKVFNKAMFFCFSVCFASEHLPLIHEKPSDEEVDNILNEARIFSYEGLYKYIVNRKENSNLTKNETAFFQLTTFIYIFLNQLFRKGVPDNRLFLVKKYLLKNDYETNDFYFKALQVIDEGIARNLSSSQLMSEVLSKLYPVFFKLNKKVYEDFYLSPHGAILDRNPAYMDIVLCEINKRLFKDKINEKMASMLGRYIAVKEAEKDEDLDEDLNDFFKDSDDFIRTEYFKLMDGKSIQKVSETFEKIKKAVEEAEKDEREKNASFENFKKYFECKADKEFFEIFLDYERGKTFLRSLPKKLTYEYFKQCLKKSNQNNFFSSLRILLGSDNLSVFPDRSDGLDGCNQVKEELKDYLHNEYEYLKNPTFDRMIYICNGHCVLQQSYSRSLYEQKTSNNECVLRYNDSYHGKVINLLKVRCRNDKFSFTGLPCAGQEGKHEKMREFFHKRILDNLKAYNKTPSLDKAGFLPLYGGCIINAQPICWEEYITRGLYLSRLKGSYAKADRNTKIRYGSLLIQQSQR